MAFIVEDFVKETTATTGTGDITLAGTAGRGAAQTFASVLSNGDTFPYAISDAFDWEVGIGTFHSPGATFTRTTVQRSSNANALVNFAAGTKNVDLTLSSTAIKTFLSTLAATTDVLTGTDAAKAVTSDALAAIWEKGADNSGGATITLGDGHQFDLITSTTTITALAFTTDKAGRMALLQFKTTRIVTHNATSLISPTGANINMQSGDWMLVESIGSGNFRIVTFHFQDVVQNLPGIIAIVANAAATNATTNLSCGVFTIPANFNRVQSVYRFLAFFTFLHTAASTPTLTLELLVNGSVVDSCVVTPIATATTFDGRACGLITIRTIGAGGTLQANCWIDGNVSLKTAAAGSTSTATDAIDTTVSRSIEMRIRMTTAVASNTLTVTQGIIEKVN